jgi:hypothetical protein
MVHLVGFTIEMYYDARTYERQIYPLHVPNKQVHLREVIFVHAAYSISRASMGV